MNMKIKRTLEKSVAILFSIVFAICSFFTLFHFEKYPLGFNHSTIKTIFFALLAVGIMVGYEKLFNGSTSKKACTLRAAIAVILLMIQVLLFLKILTPIGWDALEITNSAEYGMYNGDYFVRHTNNLFMQIFLADYLNVLKFISFLSALRKMELLNLFFVDAAIWMSVATARKIYGAKAADRVFICSVLLIGFHPTLSTIYSDTLAMPFPIGALFSIIHAAYEKKRWKQVLYVCMAGVFGIVGYYIKPTVLIVFIAMSILIFLRWKKEYVQKQFLFLVIIFVLAASFTTGVVYIREQPIKEELKRQYPDIVPLGILHYMGLGLGSLEDDPSGYGGWNEPEVSWTQQHINNANYKQEALQHIGERIAAYGPIGYAGHLFNKLVWAGSDGTFFYGLEGEFHLEEQSPQSTLRGLLQNGFYIETPFYQNWFSSWMQGVWLMICIMSMLSVFRMSECIYSSIAKLSILGLFLFLLLFENRSRYLFLYLPVLLIALESEVCLKSALSKKQKHLKRNNIFNTAADS